MASVKGECRLCSKIKGKCRNVLELRKELMDTLKFNVKIQVIEEDSLPKLACRRCVKDLKLIWCIIKRMEGAQVKLHRARAARQGAGTQAG